MSALGWMAAAFLALSLMQKSPRKLRILNLIGCTLFVVYGAAVQAWPVVIANALLAGINAWWLQRMHNG